MKAYIYAHTHKYGKEFKNYIDEEHMHRKTKLLICQALLLYVLFNKFYFPTEIF